MIDAKKMFLRVVFFNICQDLRGVSFLKKRSAADELLLVFSVKDISALPTSQVYRKIQKAC